MTTTTEVNTGARLVTLPATTVQYLRQQLDAKGLGEGKLLQELTCTEGTTFDQALPESTIPALLEAVGFESSRIDSFLSRLNIARSAPTPAAEVPAEPTSQAEPSEPAQVSTEGATLPSPAEGAADEEEDETETPVDTTPTQVPDPQPVSNIIRGLANTLAIGGTLLLAIARSGENELLVSIQPAVNTDESKPSAPPIQVKGTPDEIDAKLVDALAQYVPACELLIKTAAEVAVEAAKRADKLKADAAKRQAARTPVKPAPKVVPPKNGSLLVKVNPKDAAIEAKDASGKSHQLTHAKKSLLAEGAYTVTVTKDGFTPATKSAKLDSKSPVLLEFKLEQAAPELFKS